MSQVSNIELVDEPGAVNESIADVFAIMVLHWHHDIKVQIDYFK